MSPDTELLRRYVKARDEAAFAELVRRHLNVVYAAAIRRTNGRTHLAQEIAQKVFTDLARKAVSLQHHQALTGWLHRSTRYAAIDAARSEISRQKLNHSYSVMSGDSPAAKPETDWEKLRPVIDEAMDDLKEADREIVLLRYFEGLSFAMVGQRLGLRENAARMRTERALDRLRVLLGKRGLTSSAAALALSLANQALTKTPDGLVTTISRAAMGAEPMGALASLLYRVALHKAASVGIGVAVVVGLCGFGVSLRKASTSEAELSNLREENSRLELALADLRKEVPIQAFTSQIAAPAAPIVELATETESAAMGQHSDQGQATPENALLSYAWACDTGNATAVKRLITFDQAGQRELEKVYAAAPASVRARYQTPQDLYIRALLIASVLKPPTGVEQIKNYVATPVSTERIVLRKAGSEGKGFPIVQTAEGWRIEVTLRPGGGGGLMAVLNNELAVKLGLN